jgi:hypothetical protein
MFLCYSTEMADWNSEKTDFIAEYRKYTLLWRSLDKNYKNREERSALQELGEKYSRRFEIHPKQNKKFKIVFSLRTQQGAEEDKWIICWRNI